MKVYSLFNDESALFARILALRQQVAQASERRRPGDALLARLHAFDDQLDSVRKQIVATTEGGAITGEERLREHTDQLYAAITSWEGPPSRYQLDNIDALRSQLGEVDAEFSKLTKTVLPPLNKALHDGGSAPLEVSAVVGADDAGNSAGAGAAGTGANRAAAEMSGGFGLLKNLRLWN